MADEINIDGRRASMGSHLNPGSILNLKGDLGICLGRDKANTLD